MFRVFVSYDMDHDIELALALVVGLEETNFATCFYASRDMRAGPWHEQLTTEIERCTCLIPLLTESVDDTSDVRREMAMAVDAGKLIVPVIAGQIDPPPWQDYLIAGLQSVRLSRATSVSTRELATIAGLIRRAKPLQLPNDGYDLIYEAIELNWEAYNRGETRRCAAAYVRCALVLISEGLLDGGHSDLLRSTLRPFARSAPSDPYGYSIKYQSRSIASALRSTFDHILDDDVSS